MLVCSNLEDWHEVPDEKHEIKFMKIRNISATHLDGKEIEKDSVHEVEAHVARNLIRDGRAVAHDEGAKALDLQRPEGTTEDVAPEAPAKQKRSKKK